MGKLGGGEASKAAQEAAAQVAASRGIDLDRAVQKEQPVETPASQRAPVPPVRANRPPDQRGGRPSPYGGVPGGIDRYWPAGVGPDTPTVVSRVAQDEFAQLANGGFDAADTHTSDPGSFYTPSSEPFMQPWTGRTPAEHSSQASRDEVGEEPTTKQREIIQRQFNGMFDPVLMYEDSAVRLQDKQGRYYHLENGQWRIYDAQNDTWRPLSEEDALRIAGEEPGQGGPSSIDALSTIIPDRPFTNTGDQDSLAGLPTATGRSSGFADTDPGRGGVGDSDVFGASTGGGGEQGADTGAPDLDSGASSTGESETTGPRGGFNADDPLHAAAVDAPTVSLANPELVLGEDWVQELVAHIGEVAQDLGPQQRPQEARPVDPQAVIDTYQAFEDTLRAVIARNDPETQARVLRELGMPEDTDLYLTPDTTRELFVEQMVEQLNRERRGEEMTIAQMQNEYTRLTEARDQAERTGGAQSPDYIRLRDQRIYMDMLQHDLNQQFLRFALPELGTVRTVPLLITALDTASRDHSITSLQEVERLRQQLQGVIDTNARAVGEEPFEVPSAEDLVQALRRFEQGHSREGHYSIENTELGGIKVPKLVSLRSELDHGAIELIRSHFLEIINSRVPALVGNDLLSLRNDEHVSRELYDTVLQPFINEVRTNGPELQVVRELFAQRTYPARFMEAARRLLELPEPLDPSTEAALEAIRSMEDARTTSGDRTVIQAYLYRFVHLVGEYRDRPDAGDTTPVPQIALQTFAVTEATFEEYVMTNYGLTLDNPKHRDFVDRMRIHAAELHNLDAGAIQTLGELDQTLRQLAKVRAPQPVTT